ncbi:hypothetical protein E2C01_021907 [Portunus trituberculatus]|uniref:Uncharacterized protein n=1 Tax=Portunus trituberculatus TaxID=210409 RepID=A0A5B7E5V0_PORTR|nr:hypothetical protein [Portunus trituberculatus]
MAELSQIVMHERRCPAAVEEEEEEEEEEEGRGRLQFPPPVNSLRSPAGQGVPAPQASPLCYLLIRSHKH